MIEIYYLFPYSPVVKLKSRKRKLFKFTGHLNPPNRTSVSFKNHRNNIYERKIVSIENPLEIVSLSLRHFWRIDFAKRMGKFWSFPLSILSRVVVSVCLGAPLEIETVGQRYANGDDHNYLKNSSLKWVNMQISQLNVFVRGEYSLENGVGKSSLDSGPQPGLGLTVPGQMIKKKGGGQKVWRWVQETLFYPHFQGNLNF